MQKSTAMLTPTLNLKNHIYGQLIATYTGNIHYEGTDTWGNYLYLQVKATAPIEMLTELRLHPWYEHEEHMMNPNSIMFTFKPDEITYKTIFKPFVDGKYSQIDRAYVEKYFNYLEDGVKNMNYAVLTKSPALRLYWENKIGVKLPDDAEVWSRPEKRDEIYAYEEYELLTACLT